MTHPGPETLLAHVDRELPHEEANAVAGHIATCTPLRSVAQRRSASPAVCHSSRPRPVKRMRAAVRMMASRW